MKGQQKTEILVLGVGNEILMDDGIGPRIVRRLQQELTHAETDYSTLFLGGLDILELVRQYRQVIIVDAIKTRNGKTGDVYHLTPEDFKETLHLTTFHDVSFLTCLELGHSLGIPMPETIEVIAIEIKEDTVFGDSFTPELQLRYEEIYGEVKAFVRQRQGALMETN